MIRIKDFQEWCLVPQVWQPKGDPTSHSGLSFCFTITSKSVCPCKLLWSLDDLRATPEPPHTEGEQIINTKLICSVRADTKERMAQGWELAGRAEEGATDPSVRFECLWSSGIGSVWRKLE